MTTTRARRKLDLVNFLLLSDRKSASSLPERLTIYAGSFGKSLFSRTGLRWKGFVKGCEYVVVGERVNLCFLLFVLLFH